MAEYSTYNDFFNTTPPTSDEDFEAEIMARARKSREGALTQSREMQVRTPVRWQFTKLAAVAAVVLAIGTVAMLRAFAPDPTSLSTLVPPVAGDESDSTDVSGSSDDSLEAPESPEPQEPPESTAPTGSTWLADVTYYAPDAPDLPADSAATNSTYDTMPTPPDAPTHSTHSNYDTPPPQFPEVRLDVFDCAITGDLSVVVASGSLPITNAILAELVESGQIPHSVERLNLSGNQISDLTPVGKLTSLRFLWLSDNPITDLRPLNTLEHLEELILVNTGVTSLTGLEGLTNLGLLRAGGELTDITALRGHRKLMSLQIHGLPRCTSATADAMFDMAINNRSFRYHYFMSVTAGVPAPERCEFCNQDCELLRRVTAYFDSHECDYCDVPLCGKTGNTYTDNDVFCHGWWHWAAYELTVREIMDATGYHRGRVEHMLENIFAGRW
jgi:hypothetical protein